MATWRYEISLLLFKKYFTIFFKIEEKFSYLRAAMKYLLFVYV